MIDKYADEPTAEIDPDTYFRFFAKRAEIRRQEGELNKLKAELRKQLGDAHAGTIGGVKVITNRPVDKYREADLKTKYPDLTEHFYRRKYVTEFDMGAFVAAHPDIAAQFQSRQLNPVEIKA